MNEIDQTQLNKFGSVKDMKELATQHGWKKLSSKATKKDWVHYIDKQLYEATAPENLQILWAIEKLLLFFDIECIGEGKEGLRKWVLGEDVALRLCNDDEVQHFSMQARREQVFSSIAREIWLWDNWWKKKSIVPI